jgi:hypothetical protein
MRFDNDYLSAMFRHNIERELVNELAQKIEQEKPDEYWWTVAALFKAYIPRDGEFDA